MVTQEWLLEQREADLEARRAELVRALGQSGSRHGSQSSVREVSEVAAMQLDSPAEAAAAGTSAVEAAAAEASAAGASKAEASAGEASGREGDTEDDEEREEARLQGEQGPHDTSGAEEYRGARRGLYNTLVERHKWLR